MKTQSPDTDKRAETVVIDLLRKKTASEKFNQVRSLSCILMQLSRRAIASSVYGMARSTIDVFTLIDEIYPCTAMNRRRRDTLSEEQASTEVFFYSAEDIILNKLQRYEAGGGVSQHQ